MDKKADLPAQIFSLLKGNGFKIKIYDDGGTEITDPNIGRRFFVLDPNIMITINDPEEENDGNVEFSKGKDVGDSIKSLQKSIKKLANNNAPPLNFNLKVFGKTIQPRDYAYQAKKKKGESMMENNSMKPVNHNLLGQVLNRIKYFKAAYAYTLADDIGVDLSEVQPILNRLVQDGKVKADPDAHNEIAYSIAVEEAVMESLSRMFGSMKTSQQTLENVRILVKHKTPVDENVRGSRTRHISAIFLECNGERFRFSENYLPGARAMAQHMAHGGLINDKVGAYITESTTQLLKLQSFNRYVTTNKLINEDSSGIIETIKENIETIRTELKKLTGSKTYETVKARLETFEREALDENDVSQLKDLFTIRKFDEKFEEVLPIVKQLVNERDMKLKRIEEAASNTVLLRRETSTITPIFEFSSDHAQLGYKLNEFSLRIMENDELSVFINKIGTKLCKEGVVNDFERAILKQVFENAKIEDKLNKDKKEIKESFDLEAYFDSFDYKFM